MDKLLVWCLHRELEGREKTRKWGWRLHGELELGVTSGGRVTGSRREAEVVRPCKWESRRMESHACWALARSHVGEKRNSCWA